MTGAGGEPGPLGTFLSLNLGGSKGSTGASVIRIMRVLAPPSLSWSAGVYRTYFEFPTDGWSKEVLIFDELI